MKKSHLLYAALIGSTLILGGCHTSPSIDLNKTIGGNSGYDELKYGKSKQPTNYDNDGNPYSWKSKTIAVTDISYSAEIKASDWIINSQSGRTRWIWRGLCASCRHCRE